MMLSALLLRSLMLLFSYHLPRVQKLVCSNALTRVSNPFFITAYDIHPIQ